MAKIKLSQLLKIVSEEHIGESNSKTHVAYDRNTQKNIAKNENYQTHEYMMHKNLNKLGK